MSGIYVPVINCGESTLFKISSTESDDFLINGILPHNEDNDEDSAKITSVVEKIEKVFCKDVEDIPQQLSIINKDDSDIELQFDDSTQSITLGLISELHREENHLTFKSQWDYAVVTGDVAENFRLERVEFIEKKFEAVKTLAAKEPDKKIIFIYINDDLQIPRGYDKNFPNIYVAPFTSDTKIEYIYAELFVPKFDEKQEEMLRKAIFNKNLQFVANANFEKTKMEATSPNWNGYFIYGEGESGKTTFAYNLCTYLMSVKEYYAPIWISLDFMEGLDKLAKQKEEKFNRLTKQICGLLIPYWQENDGLTQIIQILSLKKYILVIDNLEIKSSEMFVSILKETIQDLKSAIAVIITSRFNLTDTNFEKIFSIKTINAGAFSFEECKAIALSNNPDLKTLSAEKQSKFLSTLSENYQYSPGLISFLSKNINASSGILIDETINSLKNGNGVIQDYMSILLKNSFLQLSCETKKFLYLFIQKYIEKLELRHEAWVLQKEDFLTDFDLKSVKENLSILKNLNFIYSVSNDSYAMKSLLYRTLIISDFGFAEKDKFINIISKIETAIWGNCSNTIIKDFILELRTSEYGTLSVIRDFLKDAIKANLDSSIIVFLLNEIEFYGGKKDEEINKCTNDSDSLLQVAMNNSEKAEILSLLLNNGGTPNSEGMFGESLVHGVIGNIPEFESKCTILLLKGLDINKKNWVGETPLHTLTEYGTTAQMDFIIRHGANVNAQNMGNVTALHLAAKKGDIEKIELLIENGADLSAKDLYGYQPVHYAIHNFEAFIFLVKNGADVNAKTGDGESLLDLIEFGPYIEWNYFAIDEDSHINLGGIFHKKFKQEEYVRDALIKMKVKKYFNPKGFNENWFSERMIMAKFLDNQKELFLATMVDSLDSLKDDFEDNENLLLRDENNKTLIHYAVLNPDISVAKYLIEKGLGVNISDDSGTTPLLWAAKFATNTNILDFLLNKGADISSVDNENNGILHYAAKNPHDTIADYLLKRKPDFQLRNSDGFTPLGIAAVYNPNISVYQTLASKANIEDLQHCYDFNETARTDVDLVFGFNNFSSIVSMYFGLENKNTEWEKLHEWIVQNNIDSYENAELKNKICETENNIEILQEQSNIRLYLAAKYNDNPKIAVLFARAGGDLSFHLDDEKTTTLDLLKKRSDWKYLNNQLKKHKLI